MMNPYRKTARTSQRGAEHLLLVIVIEIDDLLLDHDYEHDHELAG
jgi:hypothetical protein